MTLYTIEDETGMTVATATTVQELHAKHQAGSKVFRSQVVRDNAGKRINLSNLVQLAGSPPSPDKLARSAHSSLWIG